MNTRTIILAAVLAAMGSVATAEDFDSPPDIPTPRPMPKPMPKPMPIEVIVVDDIDLSPARRYADRGDKRTLQQAQAHADAGDARTLDAANKHAAAQVAGLRIEAFAGIASAAALVPMEPNGPGKSTLNVGVASYGGQTAIGLSFARQFNGMTLNAGASKSNNGRTLTRVGFGWNF